MKLATASLALSALAVALLAGPVASADDGVAAAAGAGPEPQLLGSVPYPEDDAPDSASDPSGGLRATRHTPRLLNGNGPEVVAEAEDLPSVANEYIVTLKPGVDASGRAPAIAGKAGGKVLRTYDRAINGFSVRLPEQAVANGRGILENDDDVVLVEPNYIAQAIGAVEQTVSGGLWGLARIDAPGQRDSTYKYTQTGAGVDIYVLDTGINTDHNDLAGRQGNCAYFTENNCDDNNGHGTHCATTAAGTTYGVAKGATVHAVKVLDRRGSGTTSGILAGMDWVIQECKDTGKLCVASMSLGYGGTVTTVDNAAADMVNAGIVVSIAAGNSDADACGYSPVTPGALIVGSLDDSTSSSKNRRSSFSNWGSCVDIFAPGRNVLAGWKGSSTAINTISGTSMACPHVSGAAALLIEIEQAKGNPNPTAGVHDAIVNSAEVGAVTDAGSGSPNKLLQTTAARTPCTDSTVSTDCDDGDSCTDDTCSSGFCVNTFGSTDPSCTTTTTTTTTPPPPTTCSTPGSCGGKHPDCDSACCDGCTGADDIYSTRKRGGRCYCASCSGESITCG